MALLYKYPHPAGVDVVARPLDPEPSVYTEYSCVVAGGLSRGRAYAERKVWQNCCLVCSSTLYSSLGGRGLVGGLAPNSTCREDVRR